MAVERTLSIIKPDAVGKNIVGKIYSRFETNGLRIVAAKMPRLSDAVAGLALQLTPEEVQALEKPYIPHAVAGFS